MSRRIAGIDWIGPQLGRVLQRFPWSVLAAFAFAIYFFFGLHRSSTEAGDALQLRLVRIPCALTAAFLWALAVALLGEARNFTQPLRQVLTLLGFAALAILVAFAGVLQVSYSLLIGALLLGVGFAPYLGRDTRQAAYWRFNHDTWVGFLAAGMATVLFGLGLSAIVETLRFLFAFTISYEVHEKIWAVSCGLVGPLYWASVVPEDFRHEIAEGPPQEFTSRMVALLVKFILVPLLLAYAVILHVYAVKIGIDGALPSGRLGWLVMLFGGMTVLTALLAYPTRSSSGALVAWFWQWWPWLLVVPVILLYVAVSVRINAYGVTESRYWAVVIATWLAVVAGLQALGGARRDLRVIPLVLAVLSLVGCLGAWGLSGWSLRSQEAELVRVLQTVGIVENGRIKPEPHAKVKIGSPEANRIISIVQFFASHSQMARLKPFFAGDANDPFASTSSLAAGRERDWTVAERVRARLGVPGNSWGNQAPNVTNYFVSSTWVAPIGEGTWLISGGHATRTPERDGASREMTAGSLRLKVKLEDSRLIVEAGGEPAQRAVFDLAALDKPDGVLRTLPEQALRRPIVLQSVEGALTATLIINQISATRGGQPDFSVNTLGYSLIVREAR